MRRPVISLFLVVALLGLASCGSDDPEPTASGGSSDSSDSGASSPAPVDGDLDVGDFEAVKTAARGQTVNWYMYGADDEINQFVNGFVADALEEEYGVTLNQVKVTDTVTVVDKVLGEKAAGRTDDGTVDAIWINGENFATGQQADLWECGYPETLPNARYVDFSVPAIATDFGVPVEGCESPWQQANSALVYNSDALGADDVKSLTALETWAQANPGRLAYPAPPDFTGSMAVRTFFYDSNGGPDAFLGPFDEAKYAPAAQKTWDRLNALEAALYQSDAYPQGQKDVERLFGEGSIDAYLTYGPGGVSAEVESGTFPASTRTAKFENGNIGNYSFLAVPANAANKAAGIVLANVLLSPEAQVELYKIAGSFPAVDLDTLPAEAAAVFETPTSPAVLPLASLLAKSLPELQPDYLTRIEEDWTANVLQK
ncbi:MAG: ABC transporter substrate-binding protein [Acidimicrobiia bacterium]